MQIPITVDPISLNKKKNRQYIEIVLKNRELLQSMIQRKQSLLLHSAIISNPEQEQPQQSSPFAELIRENKHLLNQLFERHTEGMAMLAKCLIDAQTKIENQTQMMGLIRQYEDRLGELRENMINKEIELCIQLKGRRMNFMPTKDRLREFNLKHIQQKNLKKILDEYTQLKESVQEMQKKIKQMGALTQSSIENNKQVFGKFPKSINFQRKRSQIYGEDRVLQKVYNLMMSQIEQEQKLKMQFTNLSKKFKEVQKNHKEQIARYRELQASRCQEMITQQE